MDRCPRCDSPAPHLHPATQFEGEVQVCPDAYHQLVTPDNTPERIASVAALLAREGRVVVSPTTTTEEG